MPTRKPEVWLWRNLVRHIGRAYRALGRLTPHDAQALAQIDAESGGHTHAQSPAHAHGLGQIVGNDHPASWARPRPGRAFLVIPAINLAFMYHMMSEGMQLSKSRGDPSNTWWDHALLRYYTGSLDGWDRAYDSDPNTKDTGRDYVNKITALVPVYTTLPERLRRLLSLS